MLVQIVTPFVIKLCSGRFHFGNSNFSRPLQTPLPSKSTETRNHKKKRLLMKPLNLLDGPLTTQKCTLGCPVLDRHLCGGVPCESITELVSESGCGKTQICLQLLLSSQLPASHGGLSASSIYIHSEFPFPLRRLHQLSLSFLSSHSTLFPLSYNPRDHIFVSGVGCLEEFMVVLDRIEGLILNSPSSLKLPVRLIVVDSIAALFRSEFECTKGDLTRRSSLFFEIAAKLKVYARKFGIAVVVTNQAVDVVDSDGANGMKVGNVGCLITSGRRVCPALGLGWSHCVNSRLFLSRSDEMVGGVKCLEEGFDCCTRTKRRLEVLFAPHLPATSCEYVITREGVFGVELADPICMKH